MSQAARRRNSSYTNAKSSSVALASPRSMAFRMRVTSAITAPHRSALRQDHFRENGERFQVSRTGETAVVGNVLGRNNYSFNMSEISPYFAGLIDTTGLQPETPLSATPQENAKSISALFESSWAHPGICETVSMAVAERIERDWQHPQLPAHSLSLSQRDRSKASPPGYRCGRRRSSR